MSLCCSNRERTTFAKVASRQTTWIYLAPCIAPLKYDFRIYQQPGLIVHQWSLSTLFIDCSSALPQTEVQRCQSPRVSLATSSPLVLGRLHFPLRCSNARESQYKIQDAHCQRQNSSIAWRLGLVCLWQYFDSCLLSFYDFTKPKGLLQHSDLLRGPIAPTPANPPAPPARPGCSPQRWLLQNAPRIYSLESLSRRKPSFLGLADHKGDVSHFALRLINILVNHLAQANKKRQTEKRKLKEKGK